MRNQSLSSFLMIVCERLGRADDGKRMREYMYIGSYTISDIPTIIVSILFNELLFISTYLLTNQENICYS